MRLLIGSRNSGKITEITRALNDTNLCVISADDCDIEGDPEETGSTYEENARIKARFFHHASGLATLADDSGIIISALTDELGVHTRRWGAGPNASDEEWITYFLQRMEQEADRTAAFHCSLIYIDDAEEEHHFTWSCTGVITPTLEAEYLPGLPLSACFKPDGYDTVFSAMTNEEKAACSHRGGAVKRFTEWYLNQDG